MEGFPFENVSLGGQLSLPSFEHFAIFNGRSGGAWFCRFSGVENSRGLNFNNLYLDITNFIQFHSISSHVMLKFHFCLFRLSWNNVLINSPIHFKEIISSNLTAYGGETQWGKTRFWWRKRKSSVGLGDSSIPSLGKSRICWPNKHNFLTTLSKNLNFEPKDYWHQ